MNPLSIAPGPLLAGAVVAVALGFGAAGWVTAGTAEKRISEAATAAREELATAICVNEFMAAADAKAKLAKLRRELIQGPSGSSGGGGGGLGFDVARTGVASVGFVGFPSVGKVSRDSPTS